MESYIWLYQSVLNSKGLLNLEHIPWETVDRDDDKII